MGRSDQHRGGGGWGHQQQQGYYGQQQQRAYGQQQQHAGAGRWQQQSQFPMRNRMQQQHMRGWGTAGGQQMMHQDASMMSMQDQYHQQPYRQDYGWQQQQQQYKPGYNYNYGGGDYYMQQQQQQQQQQQYQMQQRQRRIDFLDLHESPTTWAMGSRRQQYGGTGYHNQQQQHYYEQQQQHHYGGAGVGQQHQQQYPADQQYQHSQFRDYQTGTNPSSSSYQHHQLGPQPLGGQLGGMVRSDYQLHNNGFSPGGSGGHGMGGVRGGYNNTAWQQQQQQQQHYPTVFDRRSQLSSMNLELPLSSNSAYHQQQQQHVHQQQQQQMHNLHHSQYRPASASATTSVPHHFQSGSTFYPAASDRDHLGMMHNGGVSGGGRSTVDWLGLDSTADPLTTGTRRQQQQQMSFPSTYPTSLSYLDRQQDGLLLRSPSVLARTSSYSNRLSGLAQPGRAVDDFGLNLTSTSRQQQQHRQQQGGGSSVYYCLQQGQRELGEPLVSDRRWNGPQDLPASVTDDLLLNLDLFRAAAATSDHESRAAEAAASSKTSGAASKRFHSLPRSLLTSRSAGRSNVEELLAAAAAVDKANSDELAAMLLEQRLRQQQRIASLLDHDAGVGAKKGTSGAADHLLLGKAGASAAELDSLLRRRMTTGN